MCIGKTDRERKRKTWGEGEKGTRSPEFKWKSRDSFGSFFPPREF